ncbi:MAG: hypothetical protein RLZZ623_3501 [Actinomycetota bacterium]
MNVAHASTSGSAILQRFPIGFQWPTVDPFLFCVHHLDHYPAGNGTYGPAASLDGRTRGQDFEGIDGWRMYHGDAVPGFPQHPHRGFETVTFVRRGLIDHSDSLGAAARFGRGDVQWLTAGSGIVHSETFPLLDTDGPNTVELFQIWMNLPRVDKMAAPHFSMLWHDDIPQVTHTSVEGARTVVTVVAGTYASRVPPSPPPSSWATNPDHDVAIWHAQLEAGAGWTLPPARHDDALRVMYVFDGADGSGNDVSGVTIDGDAVGVGEGVVLECNRDVEVASLNGAEVLVLQGRPIGEPVAQHGPFVLNDRAGVEQAFRDYQATRFGGWPWPSDEPVHGDDPARFARQPGGIVEWPTEQGQRV